MSNFNLQDHIEHYRETQAKRIADFFVDADQINPTNGFGIAQMLRWKAEPAMIAEETMRELTGMENFLERMVNEKTSPTGTEPMRTYEEAELFVVTDCLKEWTREIMRGVGGQSTCPITNVASQCRQEALRKLVEFFTPVLRQLNKEQAA